MSEFLLLLVLALGGADYLLPYWMIIRGQEVTVQRSVRVFLWKTFSAETEGPEYQVRGETIDRKGRKRVFDMFPWHSDNAFDTPEAAQDAARAAGIAAETVGSIAVVATWRGERVVGIGKMSARARRQVMLWTGVVVALPIMGMGVWAIA